MCPIDSGGNITRPPSPIPVSGQTADAPQVNVPISDIYASMNQLAFLDGRKALRGNIPMNGYRARGAADAEQPQDYVTLAQLQALISGIGVPTGVIAALTGNVVPSGWVLANGATLSRVIFPALWSFAFSSGNLAESQAVKDWGHYGPGDGSTTFTLPDMTPRNGLFIRPVSSGRSTGTSQDQSIQSHQHTGSTSSDGSHSHSFTRFGSFGSADGGGSIPQAWSGTMNAPTTIDGLHFHNFTTNPSGGLETRPVNVAYPFIIKA